MQKITIVEDDPAMREELVLLLENEGYQVQAVTEFTEVVAQVRSFGANLVLLDLGLPGRDGFSLCADLRWTGGTGCGGSRWPAAVPHQRDGIRRWEDGRA